MLRRPPAWAGGGRGRNLVRRIAPHAGRLAVPAAMS